MADGSGFAGFERLRRSVSGEVFDDGFTRGRYATDASIYQMMPHGVVVPKTIADIEATIAFCHEQGMALLPRGGGTSQCGQTVNQAIVIDCSQYLNKIVGFDYDQRKISVEPGIVLDHPRAAARAEATVNVDRRLEVAGLLACPFDAVLRHGHQRGKERAELLLAHAAVADGRPAELAVDAEAHRAALAPAGSHCVVHRLSSGGQVSVS